MTLRLKLLLALAMTVVAAVSGVAAANPHEDRGNGAGFCIAEPGAGESVRAQAHDGSRSGLVHARKTDC